MLLKDKVAVIYGAGGAIGGAVARTFASEGAEVFLAGRSLAPSSSSPRRSSPPADRPTRRRSTPSTRRPPTTTSAEVVEQTDRLDISFDAIGIPNDAILGVPLVDLDLERFSLPITTHATSYFLTARLAARRMIPRRSGVIMTVTASHSRTGIPLVGGYGPAQALKESLTRSLSAELRRTASAWSVFDRRRCRRRTRSGRPTSPARRRRG